MVGTATSDGDGDGGNEGLVMLEARVVSGWMDIATASLSPAGVYLHDMTILNIKNIRAVGWPLGPAFVTLLASSLPASGIQ